ncbi:MAG: hypothetical protein JSR24_00490 [Proteobacteria bacterium]|nr:hypothetical protein [Pseudomonadota bacterium]
MRILALLAFLILLSACDTALPLLAPSPGPDDTAGPSTDLPYRPVMAGTAYHGIGSKP